MRSIRLSLIVYFVLLLTVALGAVSWLVYRTAADTLQARQEASHDLILTQYDRHVEETRKALDDRLTTQALTLATLTRGVTNHYEKLYLVGVIGAATLPDCYPAAAVWLEEFRQPYLSNKLHRLRPNDIHIEALDVLMPEAPSGQAREYFQSYRDNGQMQQRSESMGNHAFRLDPDQRLDPPLRAHFDDVELSPGVKLRRVTIKAPVGGFKFQLGPKRGFDPRGGPNRGGPKSGPEQAQDKPPVGPPPNPPPSGTVDAPAPMAFVQYASDVGPMDSKLADLAQERDDRFAKVDVDTQAHLAQLRSRLLWVCLITLAALWFGGVAIVQFGLAPLSRLSDAVSRVTTKDFKLDLDGSALPVELRPIAGRMAATLESLQKAFTREKQAAADISHELRTPLAALMTTVEVALKKSRNPEEYREILEECRGSGAQMQQLVERLLALARLDAGADRCRPRDVDAAAVATQCADLVRPLARAKGLTLRVHTDSPACLQTDPDKLREIVTNLLHNAIEYNRDGGSIDLAVERVNGHVSVEVRDTGIGIPPEARERIFERFFRADPSRHADTPHAGLGLAIVKSYVDLMGGSIRVDSDTGGSSFQVDIPAL